MKLGRSKALVLPAFWLRKVGLYDSTSVDVIIDDDLSFIIRPTKKSSNSIKDGNGVHKTR